MCFGISRKCNESVVLKKNKKSHKMLQTSHKCLKNIKKSYVFWNIMKMLQVHFFEEEKNYPKRDKNLTNPSKTLRNPMCCGIS